MKLFFVGAEWVIIAVMFILVLTQVLMPALRGTQMFPFFRKERKLKEAIINRNQEEYEAELLEELESREQRVTAEQSITKPMSKGQNHNEHF